MSECKITSNDLYYLVYMYLINGKISFSELVGEVTSYLKCDKKSDEYSKLVKRIKGLYDSEFGSDDSEVLSLEDAAYANYKLYGEEIDEKTILNDVSNAYYNLNRDEAKEFAEKVYEYTKRRYFDQLSERAKIIIDRNINLDKPDDDFMSLTLNEIKAYLKVNGYYVSSKNMKKVEWHNYIKRQVQGKGKSPPVSPRQRPEQYESIKDFDVCNSRNYTKEKIFDYITSKGWTLPKKSSTKEQLCKYIQEQIQKYGEKTPKKEKAISPPSSPREVRKPSVVPPIKLPKKGIEALEELEDYEEEVEEKKEKKKKVSCGKYDEYEDEEEFYVCKDEEYCDINKEKCKNIEDFDIEKAKSRGYVKSTLKKGDDKYLFIGSKEKIESLKKKLNDIVNNKKKLKDKERKEAEEKERLLLIELQKEQEKLRKQKELEDLEEEEEEEERRKIEKEEKIRKREEERIRKEEEEELKRKKEKEERRRKREEEILKKEREEEKKKQKEEEDRLKKEEQDKEKRRKQREKEEEEERLKNEKEEKERLKKEEQDKERRRKQREK